MLAEGQAMLCAITDDLIAAGYHVTTTCDPRIGGDRLTESAHVYHVENARDLNIAFDTLVPLCETALVVAPETSGVLRGLCQRLRQFGTQLINSDDRFVALTSDKHATAVWLTEKGIPAAAGSIVQGRTAHQVEFTPTEFPIVVKPVDSAGCDRTLVINSKDGWSSFPWDDSTFRIEPWIEGCAASVAILFGPRRSISLAPCLQHIERQNGRLYYCGGSVLNSGEMRERIIRVASRLIPELSAMGAVGYVGIDLILGPATDGKQDVVVEINPRLTTSYVGLRTACRHNLADAMLRIANGEETEVEFFERPTRFTAHGRILKT